MVFNIFLGSFAGHSITYLLSRTCQSSLGARASCCGAKNGGTNAAVKTVTTRPAKKPAKAGLRTASANAAAPAVVRNLVRESAKIRAGPCSLWLTPLSRAGSPSVSRRANQALGTTTIVAPNQAAQPSSNPNKQATNPVTAPTASCASTMR